VTDTLFVQLLDLACGAFLLAAVLVLWRRELVAIVRLFAVQGVALAAIVAVLAAHEDTVEGRVELGLLAVGILALRAGLLPYLVRRALASSLAPSGLARETRPLLNVSASLLAAAVLTLLAYAVSQPLIELAPSPTTRAVPIGLTVVLIGFFVLVTRRLAVSQVIGFLLIDNGITAIAFLTTAGVPLIVELGVSLDVLFAVLVLQILTTRIQATFGNADLDELRELHD
jgi:hydrogenase-4 component E